jgi:hypothetical protein
MKPRKIFYIQRSISKKNYSEHAINTTFQNIRTLYRCVSETAANWKKQLPEKYKQNFDVSSKGSSFGSWLGTPTFCLYFSGSYISPHLSCYRRYLHWHRPSWFNSTFELRHRPSWFNSTFELRHRPSWFNSTFELSKSQKELGRNPSSGSQDTFTRKIEHPEKNCTFIHCMHATVISYDSCLNSNYIVSILTSHKVEAQSSFLADDYTALHRISSAYSLEFYSVYE